MGISTTYFAKDKLRNALAGGPKKRVGDYEIQVHVYSEREKATYFLVSKDGYRIVSLIRDDHPLRKEEKLYDYLISIFEYHRFYNLNSNRGYW